MISPRIFSFTISFTVALLSAAVHAPALAKTPLPKNCSRFDSKVLGYRTNYCLYRSRPDLPRERGEAVVYFFHGIRGSALSWEKSGYAATLREIAQKEKLPPFTVVSFDTAAFSFFSDAKGKTSGRQAYESYFMNELMPKVERENSLCNRKECRFTAGLSMGGFGAMKTALKYPELFAASATNSPAIAPFSLYTPMHDWLEYFRRHPIGPTLGAVLWGWARHIFNNPNRFAENDVTELVEHADRAQFPELYFDCGDRDFFGFQEGYFRLKEILERRKLPFKATFVPGEGHRLHWTSSAKLLRWLGKRIPN